MCVSVCVGAGGEGKKNNVGEKRRAHKQQK